MSGTVTLTWYTDRGFELDLVADLEDIQLRCAAVPVPADGSLELEEGVDLNKIDILFKCQAAIDGAPAQLQEARVALRGGKLTMEAKLEDVENGLLYPLEIELDCPMPSGVPASGGPRNQSPDEDDLDWGDETTFEQVAGDVPDAALLTDERDLDDDDFDDTGFGDDDDEETPAPPSNGAGMPRGVAALFEALKNLDGDDSAEGDDDIDDDDEPPARGRPTPPPTPARREGAREPMDQKLDDVQEAIGLLRLLIDREELELEEDQDPEDLGPGASAILKGRGTDETKATKLSAWLLAQPGVADLFVDDDTLAQLIAEW